MEERSARMKIDIVRYLLDEIENEQDRQKRYEDEDAQACALLVMAKALKKRK
jgi:hypothetical protein